MADAAPAPAGPPAGVPTDPNAPGARPGGLIAQTPQALNDADIFGAAPAGPQPGPAPAPLQDHQVFGTPTPQPAPQSLNDADVFGSGGPGAIGQGPQNPSFEQSVEATGISPGAYKAVSDLAEQGGSAVGKVMNVLTVPIRAAASSVVAAASWMGVPGAKEIQAKTNPEGRMLPNTYTSDITDLYTDRAFQKWGQITGHEPTTQDQMLMAGTKLALGTAANVFTDPLRLMEFGTYTKAATDLQKIGELTNPLSQERNLLAIRTPFSDTKALQISMDSIPGKVVSGFAKDVAMVPGVSQLGSLLRALSPDTGYQDVDVATNTHATGGRGEAAAIQQQYLDPIRAKNFSPAENKFMFALGEATDNLAPNIPEKLIGAAKGKLSGTEESIRADMTKLLPKLAEQHGVDLVPGRDQSLIDGAMAAKASDSRYLENLHQAGFLNEDNIADKVIESHMPHVMDPKYRGMKLAEDIEEAHDPRPTIPGSKVSGMDPTRMRTIRTSVADANAEIEAKHGFKDFFITNPHTATAVRELESQKLIRDKNLLDVVGRYGERMSKADANSAGYAPIVHPQFSGKTIVVNKPNGSVFTNRIQDTVFPKEIAAKMSYYLNPRAVNNIAGSLGQFGDVFSSVKNNIRSLTGIARSWAFMSEGMFFRNSADNLVKGRAAGIGLDDLQSAARLLGGAEEGFRSAPNAFAPSGTSYTTDALRNLLSKWGITSGNAFREGVGDFLASAKKLTIADAAKNPARLGLRYAEQLSQALQQRVVQFGEHGENITRAALFLNRLKQGYTPEMAAYETTKYLFDYSRNSMLTNSARFFMPFIQHPLKTLLLAPEVVGQSPSTYNFVHNTFPHVLAAAFHDPVSQAEINTMLPPTLRLKDVVAGPLIPGNTWLASIFRNPKTPGNLGSMVYFDPAVGMTILNHFDYFSQEARKAQAMGNYGLTPLFGALLNVAQGHDNFGNQFGPGNPAWNYAFWKGIAGNVIMPNTEKMIKQQLGIGDPQYYEPTTVLAMKGMFGQFGGVTNLDYDAHFKLLGLTHARAEVFKQGVAALSSEARGMSSSNPYSLYATQRAGPIIPATNQEIFSELKQKISESMAEKNGQIQQLQASEQAFAGKLSASDFAARIKNIDDTIKQVNQAYQFGAQRYLQMGSGAKNPQEARAKAGIGR